MTKVLHGLIENYIENLSRTLPYGMMGTVEMNSYPNIVAHYQLLSNLGSKSFSKEVGCLAVWKVINIIILGSPLSVSMSQLYHGPINCLVFVSAIKR